MKKAILINDTSNESHIGSRCVVSIIQTLCKKYNIELFKTYTRREITEKATVLTKGIEETDIIIINGEGSLHDSPTFFKKTLLLIPSNKKVVLVNSVWQDMAYPGLNKAMKKIDLISVRESNSYEEIMSMCKPNKVFLIPDLIFYKDFSNYNNIGYCDSVNSKIRSTFMRKPNYFPLSFIHDGTYLKPKVINYPTIESFISWLRTLNILITGRFHSVCMAMITETPFLVLSSNSHKIEGLLKDAGCVNLLLKDQKEIDKKIKIIADYEDSIKIYVAKAKPKIESFWKKVSRL